MLAVMKTLVPFIIIGSVFLSGSAVAASCDDRAASIAKKEDAKLLSVKAVGEKCEIKLLIKPNSGAPKRKTVVVSK